MERTDIRLEPLSATHLDGRARLHRHARRARTRRCGYRYEGTMRSTFVKPGRREDTESWSRLRSDDGSAS